MVEAGAERGVNHVPLSRLGDPYSSGGFGGKVMELLEVSRAKWGLATILPKGSAIQRRNRMLASDVG